MIVPSQLHWKLKAGVIAEQRRLSLNADADSKMGHYHHAGATIAEAFAEAGVAPPRRWYFGKGGKVLEHLQEGSRVEASGGGQLVRATPSPAQVVVGNWYKAATP